MATQPGRSRSTRTTDPLRPDPAEVAGSETAESQETATRATSAHGEGAESGTSRTDGRPWTSVLKDAANTRISDQKHRASESIDHVARALRDTTTRMDEQGSATVAGYTRQAAEQLERFSRRLDEQDLDEMMRSAQRFARSQPWVFVGAAFGIGLVAARFLKSSSTRSTRTGRPDEWQSVGGTTYTPPMNAPSGRADSFGTTPDYRPGSAS